MRGVTLIAIVGAQTSNAGPTSDECAVDSSVPTDATPHHTALPVPLCRLAS